MLLPGRLRGTTLGDLLGTLHRASATGTLELVEATDRIHRVYFARGLVVAVELDGPTASLAEILRDRSAVDEGTLRRSLLRAMASRRLHGDVLVREFGVAAAVVRDALRAQLVLRIDRLDRLVDATVIFRVAVRAPRGALLEDPLGPPEFLPGHRRARDRDARPEAAARSSGVSAEVGRRAAALRVLGVPVDADPDAIKRAFRKRARELHPDLHPSASETERRALERRFAEVAAAYQALVA